LYSATSRRSVDGCRHGRRPSLRGRCWPGPQAKAAAEGLTPARDNWSPTADSEPDCPEGVVRRRRLRFFGVFFVPEMTAFVREMWRLVRAGWSPGESRAGERDRLPAGRSADVLEPAAVGPRGRTSAWRGPGRNSLCRPGARIKRRRRRSASSSSNAGANRARGCGQRCSSSRSTLLTTRVDRRCSARASGAPSTRWREA